MDKFDEKVIGYESTKEILRQILDILKRPEVYKRKGISIPRGLLMESDPGLGKSLLASILMEESERKPFVFRKTSQENSFLDELRAVFAMAKEEAPSILLLEDLNLYVESNSPYAPEWACLQACIDDAKDTDLFVIATTNDTRYMPPSLLRPGRFDYVIYLQPPIGENAENIVSYYLRDKVLAEDVLISDIVKAMPKVSCATLETVMNLAALNSVVMSTSRRKISQKLFFRWYINSKRRIRKPTPQSCRRLQYMKQPMQWSEKFFTPEALELSRFAEAKV